MINNVIAIIPARGGSVGIPRKNLAEIAGRSLLVHSIEHALEAMEIDRVIVSTDDAEIAEVARNAGAEVPFIRPVHLAENHVLDLPVFEHALQFMQQSEHFEASLVVHLRPTAPYRKPEWIDEAVKLLKSNPDASSVRSVSEPREHPYRVFRIGDNGFLSALMKDEHPEPYLLRRQDLPIMYHYNCVIDVTRPGTIWAGSMTGANILPYVMDPADVIDVDTPRDLEIAKIVMEKLT